MSFHKSLHCSFTTENEGNSENLFNLFRFVQLLQFLKAKEIKRLPFFNSQPFLQLCIAERKQKTKNQKYMYTVLANKYKSHPLQTFGAF